jgi:cytoskeletal protein CcmA (bactofilin family)
MLRGKIELRKHNVGIGKNGRVAADIFGKVITVEGEVHGNLYGEEQIVLRHSSTVRGNLTAPRVTLEDGSNFKGSIDMTPKETAGSGPELRAPAGAPRIVQPSGSSPAHPGTPKIGP